VWLREEDRESTITRAGRRRRCVVGGDAGGFGLKGDVVYWNWNWKAGKKERGPGRQRRSVAKRLWCRQVADRCCCGQREAGGEMQHFAARLLRIGRIGGSADY
jgi:hypothetical protein